MKPFWLIFFSKGLVQPPTSWWLGEVWDFDWNQQDHWWSGKLQFKEGSLHTPIKNYAICDLITWKQVHMYNWHTCKRSQILKKWILSPSVRVFVVSQNHQQKIWGEYPCERRCLWKTPQFAALGTAQGNFDPSGVALNRVQLETKVGTLQGMDTYPTLGSWENHLQNANFWWDMLVSWRVHFLMGI